MSQPPPLLGTPIKLTEAATTDEGLKLIKMNDVKRRAYFNYLMLINMFCKTTKAAPITTATTIQRQQLAINISY